MELVPLEDVGFREPEMSKVSETLNASSTLHILGVRRVASGVSGTNYKEEYTNFLEMYEKRTCTHEFGITQ